MGHPDVAYRHKLYFISSVPWPERAVFNQLPAEKTLPPHPSQLSNMRPGVLMSSLNQGVLENHRLQLFIQLCFTL